MKMQKFLAALLALVMVLTLLVIFVIERIKKHAYRLPTERKNPEDIYNEGTPFDGTAEEDGNRNDGSK